MKKSALFSLLFPLLSFGQSPTVEINSQRHDRRLFELSAMEGYTIHQNKGADRMYFDKAWRPLPKTGVDYKTQIKAGFYPFRFLSFGFIGSNLRLSYAITENSKVYSAVPMWQFGAFADYNQKIGKNVVLFGGFAYSKIKIKGKPTMVPQPPGSEYTYNRYSTSFVVGAKYKIVGGLYGLLSLEQASMTVTNYVSISAGVSFKF